MCWKNQPRIIKGGLGINQIVKGEKLVKGVLNAFRKGVTLNVIN